MPDKLVRISKTVGSVDGGPQTIVRDKIKSFVTPVDTRLELLIPDECFFVSEPILIPGQELTLFDEEDREFWC